MNIPKKQPETKAKTRQECIDLECRMLCEVMNKMPGIQTVESCCGHGEDEFCIWFMAKNLEALPALLYHFDVCHSGISGWVIEASTDCAMSPVIFLARSTSKGQKAYNEANAIASIIDIYVKSR